MPSFWSILTAIAPILAPVISLLLILVGRIIWNHEKRIRSVEEGQTRHSRTLYGDDEDAQQAGIAKDIRNLTDRVSELQRDVRKIRKEISED